MHRRIADFSTARSEQLAATNAGMSHRPPAALEADTSTMPEESTPDPVELTRLAFEAANQRDIDTIVSFFAPDANFAGRALGDVFEGRAAIREFLGEWFGSFEEVRYEVEDLLVLVVGPVITVVNQEGRPVGGDGQVHQREAWAIWWSPDGLIARLTIHADLDEARVAAERLTESRG